MVIPEREVPAARELRVEVTPQTIEQAVCDAYRVNEETLQMRGKWHNEARAAVAYFCRKLTSTDLAAIGARLGGIRSAAVCRAASDVERKRATDRRLDAQLSKLERHIIESKK